MEKLLCPSMMCADVGHLERELRLLEEANVDIFHLDVMDGNFVPNFGMGLQDIEYLCKNSTIPCDVHLMVTNPIDYIERFVSIGAKIIYIHPETDKHACRTLQKIKDAKVKAGIAINPGTSFESVKELLYLCDYVMVMSVNPGFSGQKYLEFVTPKIKRLVEEEHHYGGYKIMLDGACSPEKIEMLSKAGVNGFVLGTSALFHKGIDYKTICKELRGL